MAGLLVGSFFDDSNAGQKTAKAWINFDGTGTVAIRDSFNVSSLTDNATGDYTVTFATAFANINYVYAVCSGNDNVFISSRNYSAYPPTTTASRLASVLYNGGGKSDDNAILAVYFGD